jgi:hypothetical protein
MERRIEKLEAMTPADAIPARCFLAWERRRAERAGDAEWLADVAGRAALLERFRAECQLTDAHIAVLAAMGDHGPAKVTAGHCGVRLGVARFEHDLERFGEEKAWRLVESRGPQTGDGAIDRAFADINPAVWVASWPD